MVAYTSLLIATREVEILLMLAGQLLCEAVNFGLKRLIRQERPTRMHGKGYGMPSSHAQFMAFWAMYLALFISLRHAGPHSHRVEKWGLVVAAVVGAVAVATSRVYLGYHSQRQVVVGMSAGFVFAIWWFWVVARLRESGWVDWALGTSLARLARVRDLLLDEDLAHAGWVRWEDKRKAKTR